jgi:hypothetical protein
MFNKVFAVLILLLGINTGIVKAQNATQQLAVMEDSLVKYADSMYLGALPEDRQAFTEKFVKNLVQTLKLPNSYNYPFSKLQEKINIIYPDDKSFRVFNWSIAATDIMLRYYGAIQMPGETLKLHPLYDYTAELGKGAEDSVLTNGKWFGALYYRIIPENVNGQKVYCMLGVNGSSPVSTKKVIDPMTITPQGVVFGAPVFNIRSQNNNKNRINRFVMEYKKGVQAALNWDNDMQAIYFDRLESEMNDPNRKYTYVPTGQYDGLRWIDGYWNMVQDLIPIDPLKDGQAPAPSPVKPK